MTIRARRLWPAAAVLTLAAMAALPAAAQPSERIASSQSPDAAERCRTVVKRVAGKRRAVRVCPKPKAPTPKNVAMRLDSAHAARATIGPAGGTVAAVEADGTRYTLAFPAGALAVDTTVSLTPLASAATPRAVRLVGGVQFAPEGLALAKPAALTIDLPRGAARVHAFGWFGVGRNVHRHPLRAAGRRLTMRVTHFSGVGAATGADEWLPRTESALTIQFGRYIRPAMRRAETDDNELGSAFNAAFGWMRAVELVGLQARFKTWRAEVMASYYKALANAVRKATDRCVDGHDLTQVGRLMGHARTVQMLGIPVRGVDPLERAIRCARFELDIEILNRVQAHDGSYNANHVRLTALPITMGAGLVLSGSKTYEYVSVSHNTCGEGQGRALGPFSVTRLLLPLDDTAPDGKPLPREVELDLVLGPADGSVSCSGMTFPVVTYHPIFGHMHADERTGDTFAIRGWQWVGGAVVARKTYDRTQTIEGGAGFFREQTTLTLRHAPTR